MARINQRFDVEVTTEFMVALFIADTRKAGIKAKQRLEFLLVAESPAMRDTWDKMVASHEANAPVYKTRCLSPISLPRALTPRSLGAFGLRARITDTRSFRG